MTVTPADLAAVGWDDLGLTSGQTLAAADLADRTVWPTGAGPEQDAVHDALLAVGWQQGSAATFATVWDPDRTDLGRQVDIEIVAYAEAAGAAQGFALVPDVYPTGPTETVAGAHRLGADARLVRVDARDPQAGTPAQELALGFRHERLTARVLLRDWTGAEPAVATVEALAARLLARIEHVLEHGGPGLSLHALRVERSEIAPYFAHYLRLDGADIRQTYESPEAFSARVASYGAASGVFTSGTEIAADDDGYPLGFEADLYRFLDADRASALLRGAAARLGQGTDITAIGTEDEIVGIGDEAIAVAVASDSGGDGMEGTHTSAVLVRVGVVAAEIRLTRTYKLPPASAAKELAGAQAACLAAADCLRWQPLPASLAGG